MATVARADACNERTLEGTSIFKEMVQNADDAGATEVNFCLDRREHSAERLAYTKLEAFQGAYVWLV